MELGALEAPTHGDSEGSLLECTEANALHNVADRGCLIPATLLHGAQAVIGIPGVKDR